VSSYGAKTHLLRLLERVANGEQITITEQGVPIAKVVPVSDADRHDTSEVIERIKAFRKGHTLGGLSVREMINEGKKY
jgi:prevent-host-death family protein